MLPNNNLYTLKTAIVETTSRQNFMSEVSQITTKMLNEGFEVTKEYAVSNSGFQNMTTTHYMYIEGKKLKKEPKTV